MDDHLESAFREATDGLDVAIPPLQTVTDRGKKLALKRRAIVGMVGFVILGSVYAVPRTDQPGRALFPEPPAGDSAGELSDLTVLSIDAAAPEWGSGEYFVSVVHNRYGASDLPSPLVCFSMPKWVEQANVMDAEGSVVATHPGPIAAEELDDGKMSCSLSGSDRAVLERLALHPEDFTVEITGGNEPISSGLHVQFASDPGKSDFDERDTAEYGATVAIDHSALDDAARIGRDRLARAIDENHWDYGNAIHYGHLILGHVALRRGNAQGAEQHLLAAGRTPGSPQLASFGPNMSLARELLAIGREEVVLEFLELVDVFWNHRDDLDRWTDEIKAGRMPDFGPNLGAGWLEPQPLNEDAR